MSGFGRNKLNPASQVKWQAPPNPVDFESSLKELVSSDPFRRKKMEDFFSMKMEEARKAGDGNKALSIEMLKMQYDFDNQGGNVDKKFLDGFHKFLTGRLSEEDAADIGLSNPAWAKTGNYWRDEHQISMMALPGVAGYVNALADERYMMEKKILLMREFGPIQLNSKDRTPDINSLWLYYKYGLNKKGLDAIDFLDDWKFFHDLRFDTRSNKLYRYNEDDADYLDEAQRAEIMDSHAKGIFAKQTDANGDQLYTRRPIDVGLSQRITNPSAPAYKPNKKAKAPTALKGKKASKKQKIKPDPGAGPAAQIGLPLPPDPADTADNQTAAPAKGGILDTFKGFFGFGSKVKKEDQYNRVNTKRTENAMDAVAGRQGIDLSKLSSKERKGLIAEAQVNAALANKLIEAIDDFTTPGRIAEVGSEAFEELHPETKARIGRARTNIEAIGRKIDTRKVTSPTGVSKAEDPAVIKNFKEAQLRKAGIADDQASVRLDRQPPKSPEEKAKESFQNSVDNLDYGNDKAVRDLRERIMLDGDMNRGDKRDMLKEIDKTYQAEVQIRDAQRNAEAKRIQAEHDAKKGKNKRSSTDSDEGLEAAIKQLQQLDADPDLQSSASDATRAIDTDDLEKLLEETMGNDVNDFDEDEIGFLAEQLNASLNFVDKKKNSPPATVTDQADLEKDLSAKRKQMPEQSKSPKKKRPPVPAFKKPAPPVPKLNIPDNKSSDVTKVPVKQFMDDEDDGNASDISTSSAVSLTSPRKGRSGRKKERGGVKTVKSKSASGEERQEVLGSPKTDLSSFLPDPKIPRPPPDSKIGKINKFLKQPEENITKEEAESIKEELKSRIEEDPMKFGTALANASRIAANKSTPSTPNPQERETVAADQALIEAELKRMANEGLRDGRSKSISGKGKKQRGSMGSVRSRGSAVSDVGDGVDFADSLIDQITPQNFTAYGRALSEINRLNIKQEIKDNMIKRADEAVSGSKGRGKRNRKGN